MEKEQVEQAALLGESTEEDVQEVAEPEVEETGDDEEVTPTAETDEVPASVEGLKAAKVAETKKRQEAEAKARELEERLAALEATKAEPQKPESEMTIDDWYEKDPKGTQERINAEIARLMGDDPYANAAQVERLRDLKIELKERASTRFEAKKNQFLAELNKAVPDFVAKQKGLSEFAKAELGYDDETLNNLSNPLVVGPRAAISFVKSIAKVYEKSNAASTVGTKQVKPQPTRVEAPGQGLPPRQDDLKAAFKRAEETGSWAEYLVKAGLV
jgi:hypothetical protein